MAAKANIVAYVDSTATAKTLKPYTSKDGVEQWIDSNSTIPGVLKATAEMSRQTTKDGIERRMCKVALPIAGTTTSLVNGTLVNTPTAAYTIPAYIVLPVPRQATDADVADALKLLINTIMGDEAAGTIAAFSSATNQARDFLIHGFLPS